MRRTQKSKDAAVGQWLRSEVVPVYDPMKADPSRGISAHSVFAQYALATRQR
jgi:hypothetical protein